LLICHKKRTSSKLPASFFIFHLEVRRVWMDLCVRVFLCVCVFVFVCVCVCFLAAGCCSGRDSLVWGAVTRRRGRGLACGLDSRSFLSAAAGRSYFPLQRKEGDCSTGGKQGGLAAFLSSSSPSFSFFQVFSFAEERHFFWVGNPSARASSSHAAARCLAAGGFFTLLRGKKLFAHPQDSPPPPPPAAAAAPPAPLPVSPIFFASFSPRWDEFGQSRRGGESTGGGGGGGSGPRRRPRVSLTENFQQQSGNFRELQQRVLGHGAGR